MKFFVRVVRRPFNVLSRDAVFIATLALFVAGGFLYGLALSDPRSLKPEIVKWTMIGVLTAIGYMLIMVFILSAIEKEDKRIDAERTAKEAVIRAEKARIEAEKQHLQKQQNLEKVLRLCQEHSDLEVTTADAWSAFHYCADGCKRFADRRLNGATVVHIRDLQPFIANDHDRWEQVLRVVCARLEREGVETPKCPLIGRPSQRYDQEEVRA